MSAAIVSVDLKDKALLKEQLTAYLAKINNDVLASTDYPYFEGYEIAGFVLINQWSVLCLPTDFAIAESLFPPYIAAIKSENQHCKNLPKPIKVYEKSVSVLAIVLLSIFGNKP